MPVLGTKLHVPAMRRRLVPRPRLTDRPRVEPTSMPRLVLVSAPAGFGKTTLVAQWLAPSERGDGESEPGGLSPRVAWLSLDAGDSEPRRFITHLVAAIQASDPQAGAEALALLESDRAFPAEAVLVSLVNDLDGLSGPTVLALDDYHVIDAPDIHESVTFLLDHLPPQVTMAITTRADPPLPLARRTRSSTTSWASTSTPRTSPRSSTAPRGGPPGCSWPPCRHAAAPAPGTPVGWQASSTRSPAATALSWTTWSRRCSTASRTTFAGSSWTP